MLLVLGFLLLMAVVRFLPGTAGQPEPPPAQEEEPLDPGDPLYFLKLFERALAQGEKGEEILAELAGRVDAVGYEANLELARRRIDRGENPDDYLRKALELHESKDIREMLAICLAESGLVAEARAEYLELLPDMTALDGLVSLETEPAVIAGALAEGRHWQALREYAENLPESERSQIGAYYSRALVELGEYKAALPLLAALRQQNPEDRDIRWLAARALEGSGQDRAARAEYAALGKDGAFRLGIMLEKEGRRREAAIAFVQSEEPAGLWRGAVIQDELGNAEEALAAYLELAKAFGMYQDDAAYRAYILLGKMGQPVPEEITMILRGNPAWAARLGLEAAWNLVDDPVVEVPGFLVRAAAYREAGNERLAALELAIGGALGSAADKIALGEWYLDQGDVYQAVRYGAEALKELPCRRAYQLAYPLPFGDVVSHWAKEYNLEPAKLYAVIREESRFQPGVISRAGALGLMQIMPATGRDIAAQLKVDFQESLLFEPWQNVRFGAFYLRSMLDMFGGDFDKALAAYNGGPGNARRWSAGTIGAQELGFPTAISYNETREYITKVMNSYCTYLWLYGEEIRFP